MAVCKTCKVDKPKIGKILRTSTGGVKYVYYVAEGGNQWWGSVCPECHADKARTVRKPKSTKSCSECQKTFSTAKDGQVVCSLKCRETRRTRQAREKRSKAPHSL